MGWDRHTVMAQLVMEGLPVYQLIYIYIYMYLFIYNIYIYTIYNI